MQMFFQNRTRVIFLLGLFILMMLGIGLQQAKSDIKIVSSSSSIYNAEVLYKYKTPYLGDNSKVIHLIDNLPYANLREKVFLQTEAVPYGVTLEYDFSNAPDGPIQIEANFQNNAVILFALIENVDEIIFITKETGQFRKYHYQRSKLQKNFAQTLWNYSKDIPTLDTLLKGLPNPWPTDFDAVLSQAVMTQGKGYKAGEVATEGHILLDTEESNGKVKAYTLVSFGWFEFENGIFTKTSGSGVIPTVITFAKNEKGEYSLIKYQEPEDGAYYTTSLKKMFPTKLRGQVLNVQSKYTNILAKQQEFQATNYLKSIGRDAKVSAAHVEKRLADIDVQASNKIFAELTKYDSFLNDCPYWLGTREQIEDGVRYIYETSQSKTSDGHDRITFRKLKEDKTVVKEQMYQIVGTDVIAESI